MYVVIIWLPYLLLFTTYWITTVFNYQKKKGKLFLSQQFCGVSELHSAFETELILPSSVNPDHQDNHHSSAISNKSLAALNVWRCCVVSWRAPVSPQMSGGRGHWRLSTTPNGPWFPFQGPVNGLHYVSLKNQNGLRSGFPSRSRYRWNSRVFQMNAQWKQKPAVEDRAQIRQIHPYG